VKDAAPIAVRLSLVLQRFQIYQTLYALFTQHTMLLPICLLYHAVNAHVDTIVGEWELERFRKEVGVLKPKEQEFARSVWRNQRKPKTEWLVCCQRCELDTARKTVYSVIATWTKRRLSTSLTTWWRSRWQGCRLWGEDHPSCIVFKSGRISGYCYVILFGHYHFSNQPTN